MNFEKILVSTIVVLLIVLLCFAYWYKLHSKNGAKIFGEKVSSLGLLIILISFLVGMTLYRPFWHPGFLSGLIVVIVGRVISVFAFIYK